MKDELARALADYFRSIGIDPLYASTLGVYILLILNRKNLRDWKDLDGQTKYFLLSVIFGAAVLSLVCFIETLYP